MGLQQSPLLATQLNLLSKLLINFSSSSRLELYYILERSSLINSKLREDVAFSSDGFYPLFDGHNGSAAAIYIKENLLNNVISAIPPNLNRGKWVAALPRALVAGFVYFESDEVHACIVTCGGLCPGLNTVIREIGGYRGFYAQNTIPLTPKVVNDIHKRGWTILGTSRGGYETSKIVDSIQDRGVNQVYIIGGDGTKKGVSVIYEEIRRRALRVSVIGIPKTIDNDILVIDKSFGFDYAVEEAQRAINAAHVESESSENCIGLVKLMGRIHCNVCNSCQPEVNCCLIPESPFYLEEPGGLFDYIEKRLKENGYMVIVIAEGAQIKDHGSA
ncbi:hypothetical protein ACFE04_008252 [Oxalis oulophora]